MYSLISLVSTPLSPEEELDELETRLCGGRNPVLSHPSAAKVSVKKKTYTIEFMPQSPAT